MKIWKKLLLGTGLLLALLVAVVVGVGWWLSVDIPASSMARVEASAQRSGDRFVNIEPQRPYELDWAQVQAQFFGKQQRVPAGRIPVVPLDATALASPPAPGLRVTWLGHSSVLVELDGVRILVDPVLSERASPFQFAGPRRFHPPPVALDDLTGIDAAVHSHNHYDHLDEATVRHLSAQGTRLFVPLGMGGQLARWGVPADQIHELDWWEARDVGGVRVVATPARHYSGRGIFDYKATLWASWTLVGPAHRVFYSGDSGYSASFAEIGERFGPFDVDIIKIGAYGPGAAWLDIHMPVDQAMQVHEDVRGKRLLPVHWATFNLAHHAWDEPIRLATVEAARRNIDMVTPRVGQPVAAGEVFRSEAWWEGVD